MLSQVRAMAKIDAAAAAERAHVPVKIHFVGIVFWRVAAGADVVGGRVVEVDLEGGEVTVAEVTAAAVGMWKYGGGEMVLVGGGVGEGDLAGVAEEGHFQRQGGLCACVVAKCSEW